MSENIIEIGAEGIDAAKIVEEIQADVKEKMKAGFYSDPVIARAERTNLDQIKDEDGFLTFYLECLRDSVFIDINDFDISERRARFSKLLVILKKTIWSLLRFYTYRLWSQQNQVNGLLLAAVESTESRYADKVKSLEARIAKLESALEETQS